MTVRVGQVRRMVEIDGSLKDYTVTEVYERHGSEWVGLVMEDDGSYHEWLLSMVEKDVTVTEAPTPDPANPQVGDRFRIFDRPDRTYEVLEVGESTVTVRYSIETTWPTDYCKGDIPL